ncbi:DnaJ like protein subfamily B member 13 [Melipona quadrifasciata]|uniref:DnaJ like protein subfamily B member 13 n=1 Tax=Melipona quadrifasciata TaxID=166423 RepID=A0A0M9ABR2_9HYME|nr:DnaJ like protein subfamily B member 13 [Melipona quadrifasciata]
MSCDESCSCNRRGIDYYGVLSLKKDCNDLEIKAAFRRLAIRYNPKRAKGKCLSTIFALVAEAYDVLSDPLKRTIYDQFGEEGLKNGVPGAEEFIQPYTYHGEPMRTYKEFFGTESPYADLLYVLTQSLTLLEFPEGRGIKRKEEPLIKTLYLTLVEVFLGGIKKMKIQRLVLVGDDKSRTVTKEKILTIPIKPGIPTGTRIVFPEEGDQGPTKIPADRNGLIVVARIISLLSPKHVSVADVIFITEDRPHETFRREGSDLHMTVDIFLREALTGTVVTVNTLDDRTLRIPLTSVITPDYRKRVAGEGLPLPEDPKQRGSLIMSFNIEYPVYLPVSNKTYVKRAFDTSEDIRDTEYVHRLILANKMRKNVDFDVPVRRQPDRKLAFVCNT